MNIRHVISVSALLFAASTYLPAQTAPRPIQLGTAKTVFLSNAATTFANSTLKTDFYDTFYNDLQNLNRFGFVAAPGPADLVLELDGGGGHYTLRILDPKSAIVLWSMSEAIVPAVKVATALKNEHAALLNLAGDLKQVCLQ